MSRIIGVRFRNAGRSYYYDPGEFDVRIGDHVIVESEGSTEYGTVSIPPIEMNDEKLKKTPIPIIRVATEEDEQIIIENKEKEKESFKIAKEKIREHELDMKLVQTEYSFERNKILFYFTAEGRVDFRNLVKDLASVFRTRIELRQIGVRDETRILGGLGICGRELCCKSFLTDFAPVSIKMAKEQNLSLNPTKISGVCGRLMCCLTNESETYEYLNKQMPSKGDGAITEDGEEGIVSGLNILRQKVSVIFEENDSKEMREYDVSELTFIPKKKRLAMQKELEESGEKNKPEEKQSKKAEKPRRRQEDAEDKKAAKDNPDKASAETKEVNEDVVPETVKKQKDKKPFNKNNNKKDFRDKRDNKEKKENAPKKDNKDRKDIKDKKDNKEGKPVKDKKPKKEFKDKKERKHTPKDLSKRNGGYRPYQHKQDNSGGDNR
ncbi:MAG: stage 0 sporulation family protein [Lachnospiraceae bacterium]|nr:stage 0 sporulation family protein [Lachnospiraceae bacterium]